MREYKFRGKRKDNGEWVYGFIYEVEKGTWRIHNEFYCADGIHINSKWYGVKAETIGQFTGLRDKNGKEIYEGDILDEKGYNFTVVFDPKWAKFKLQHDGKVIQYPEWNRGVCMEVIGNIHDNPELLKGDRE